MNWPFWAAVAAGAITTAAFASLAWWLLGLFEGSDADDELPPDNFEYVNPQDWGDQ